MLEQFAPGRNQPIFNELVAVLCRQPEFQIGGLLNLGAGVVFIGIGEPGQLDEDSIASGRLDDRLGHAKLIDPFAEDLGCLR